MKLVRSLSLFLLFSISTACGSNPKPQVDPQAPEEKPPEPIVLRVYPEVCLAQCDIRIEWRIPRNPNNRNYEIVLKEDTIEISRHSKSLDGENETAAFPPIYIRGLYGGEYSVEAILTRIEGGQEKEYRSVKKVKVAAGSEQ